MNTKRAVLWVLAGLNALLLLGVVLSWQAPAAYAQGAGRASYILIPAQYSSGEEAIWVVDQAGLKVAVYVLNYSRGSLALVGGRDLKNDFRGRNDR